MVIAKADPAGTGVTSAWPGVREHDHVQCSQHPDQDREGDQGDASASRREVPAVGDPSECVERSEQSEGEQGELHDLDLRVAHQCRGPARMPAEQRRDGSGAAAVPTRVAAEDSWREVSINAPATAITATAPPANVTRIHRPHRRRDCSTWAAPFCLRWSWRPCAASRPLVPVSSKSLTCGSTVLCRCVRGRWAQPGLAGPPLA
jgi:hypothetical protein